MIAGVGVLPLACCAACPGFLARGRPWAVGVLTGSGLVRPLRRAGPQAASSRFSQSCSRASPRAGEG